MCVRKAGVVTIASMLGAVSPSLGCFLSGVAVASSVDSIPESVHAQAKQACKPSPLPSAGMHCINTNGDWVFGEVEIEGQKCPFLKTTYVTAEGKKVTIVAGALGSPKNQDYKTRGVEPPKRAETNGALGFSMMHCKGAEGKDEIIEMRRGFMAVDVGPKGSERTPVVSYWPLIVRSRSIPAGAFGTTFVIMGSDRSVKGSETAGDLEVVARPNQKSDCDKAGTPDGQANIVVIAQPKSPKDSSELKETSVVRWVKGTPVDVPEPPDAEEQRFLVDVCKFVKLAMAASTDKNPRLEVTACGAPMSQSTPEAPK